MSRCRSEYMLCCGGDAEVYEWAVLKDATHSTLHIAFMIFYIFLNYIAACYSSLYIHYAPSMSCTI